jgi:hypothetical protein
MQSVSLPWNSKQIAGMVFDYFVLLASCNDSSDAL